MSLRLGVGVGLYLRLLIFLLRRRLGRVFPRKVYLSSSRREKDSSGKVKGGEELVGSEKIESEGEGKYMGSLSLC
jgi:hypothetical protein